MRSGDSEFEGGLASQICGTIEENESVTHLLKLHIDHLSSVDLCTPDIFTPRSRCCADIWGNYFLEQILCALTFGKIFTSG